MLLKPTPILTEQWSVHQLQPVVAAAAAAALAGAASPSQHPQPPMRSSSFNPFDAVTDDFEYSEDMYKVPASRPTFGNGVLRALSSSIDVEM